MELGLTRRNVGRLVLLAWAVALAWLARRELSGGESAATAERTTRLAPGAEYFAVLAGGRQVGQLNISVDTLVDGVRLTELLVLDLPDGDSTHQLARSTEYALTRSLRLRRFTRTIFGDGMAERLQGELAPDSTLSLATAEGSATTAVRSVSRMPPDLATMATLPYRMAFGGSLRAGARMTVPLLDLGRGTSRPVQVRVTAESSFVVADSAVFDTASGRWVAANADTVRGFRLEHDGPGAPTVTWVDAGGGVLRQETAGGLTMVRSAFELVRNNYRAIRQDEAAGWRRGVPGLAALAGSGLTPDSTGGTRRFLVLGDSGAPAGHPADLAGGRQRLAGDTLTITRDPVADSTAAPPGPDDWTTRPGWDVPAGDERVAAAAREAVRGARTARDSVAGLVRWVARQIATDGSGSAPSAAFTVIRSGRGTPDGKARLLAAMARAAGLPARVATGVAVLPGGAYSHAWTEVWQGGWLAADPAFGHFPAATILVRIAVGDRSRPVVLAPLVASARFLPLRTP